MHVKWTRTALLNLDSAIEYITADRPMAAKEIGQKIWDYLYFKSHAHFHEMA